MPHSRTSHFWALVLGSSLLYPLAAWPQNKTSTPSSPVTSARSQISRNQLDAAEKTLWTVLSSTPDDADALTLLGIIRGKQKRYAEAEALFRRAIHIAPDSLVAHRNLAESLIAQSKPDPATDEYKEVVKLAPHDYAARLALARLLLGRGEFADALTNLNSIPREHLPVEALPAQAASLLGLGRKQEAAALIPRAKHSPAIAADLAEIFLDGGAPEYALQTIDAAPASAQNSSRFLYLKGRALQATGNSSASLASLQEALNREPKSVDTLIAIAALEAARNDHGKSVSLLKRAYTIQPDSPVVLRALIVEGMKAQDRKTAVRAAQALANSGTENLDDLYLAAAAMLEGQDFAGASSIFEKYVVRRPQDAKGFLGLGIAQLAQQNFADAHHSLEHAIEVDPKLAEAEYQLGVIAERKGAADESIQHFERAIQLSPQHAKALASLGAHYLQAGDLEKARNILERSVASNPNDYKAQYDLGLTLSKLGRTEEARQHMELSRSLRDAEDLLKTGPPSPDRH